MVGLGAFLEVKSKKFDRHNEVAEPDAHFGSSKRGIQVSRSRSAAGRHRSARRTKTPLSVIAGAVTSNAGAVGRRSAVFAASSGLAMTMGVPAASATPDGKEKQAPELKLDSQDVPEVPKSVKLVVPAAAKAEVKVATVAGIARTVAPAAPAEQAPVEAALAEAAPAQEARAARAAQPVARTAPSARRPQAPAAQRPAAPAQRPAAPAQRPAQERQRPTRPAPRANPREIHVPDSKDVQAPGKAEKSVKGKAAAILATGRRYFGVPYRWGGTSPRGFDCSGYVQYVYRQHGISLPRTSGAQKAAGRRVSAKNARPGDLVWKPGHIGIYAGGGYMYHAPRTGKTVRKQKIWFKPVYIRVIG